MKIALFCGLGAILLVSVVSLGIIASDRWGAGEEDATSADGVDGAVATGQAAEEPYTPPAVVDGPPAWAPTMLPDAISTSDITNCGLDTDGPFGIETPSDGDITAIACTPGFGGQEVFKVSFIEDPNGVDAVQNGAATYDDIDLGIGARPGHSFRVIQFQDRIDVYDYTDDHVVHYELSGDEAAAQDFIQSHGLAG